MSTHTYGDTLRQRGFQPFLWTQFLGAFNDNFFKIVVSMMAVHLAISSADSGRNLSLAAVLFNLPFLLFSGYAGQLADLHSKRTVLIVTKSLEIVTAEAVFGSGHTRVISIFFGVTSLVRIPLAWALARWTPLGPLAIAWTIAVTCIVRSFFIWGWFKRGTWKRGLGKELHGEVGTSAQ
jgi:hypothetical protein